jgi:hypothetical protein
VRAPLQLSHRGVLGQWAKGVLGLGGGCQWGAPESFRTKSPCFNSIRPLPSNEAYAVDLDFSGTAILSARASLSTIGLKLRVHLSHRWQPWAESKAASRGDCGQPRLISSHFRVDALPLWPQRTGQTAKDKYEAFCTVGCGHLHRLILGLLRQAETLGWSRHLSRTVFLELIQPHVHRNFNLRKQKRSRRSISCDLTAMTIFCTASWSLPTT